MAETKERYFATLVKGKVYYFADQRFDVGVEEEVDENSFRYLRTREQFDVRTTGGKVEEAPKQEQKPQDNGGQEKAPPSKDNGEQVTVNLNGKTVEDLDKEYTAKQLDYLALEVLGVPEDEYTKSGDKKVKAGEILDFWNAAKE